MIKMPLVLALFGGAAFVLAGCTPSPPNPNDATPRPTATSSRDAFDDGQVIDLLPISDGAVAATGTFDASGPIRGSITVVKEGDDYRLNLTGFRAPVDVDFILTSQGAATGQGCYDRWGIGFGEPTTWSGKNDIPGRSIGLHIGYMLDPDGKHPDLVDPTFLDTVAVTSTQSNGTCVLTTLGTATLTWVGPTLRAELHASDAGPAAGAQGSVSADGGLYTVAAGDTIANIAGRFELSAEDLRYLNPISGFAGGDTTIYPGQVLNLSATGRGHPSLSHD